MTVLRFIARVVIVAIVCAFTTSWFGWMSLPVVGFIYALADRQTRARGSIAAVGAALGWLTILGADAARGASVRMVALRVGEVMQLSAISFIVVTIGFAAILTGTAAVLAGAIARNR